MIIDSKRNRSLSITRKEGRTQLANTYPGDWLFGISLVDTDAAELWGDQPQSRGTASRKQKTAFSKNAFPRPLIRPRENVDEKAFGSFCAIQEWEGYVTKFSDGIVFAELVDVIKNEKRPSTLAEIPYIEFQDEDVDQIREGSVFRWSVG